MTIEPPTPIPEILYPPQEDLPMGITYDEASELLVTIQWMDSTLEFLSTQSKLFSTHEATRLIPRRISPMEKEEIVNQLKDLLRTLVVYLQEENLELTKESKEFIKETVPSSQKSEGSKSLPLTKTLLTQIKNSLRELSSFSLPKEKLLLKEIDHFFQDSRAFLLSQQGSSELGREKVELLFNELKELKDEMEKAVSKLFISEEKSSTEKPFTIMQELAIRAEKWIKQLTEAANYREVEKSGKKTLLRENREASTSKDKPSSFLVSLQKEISKDLRMHFLEKNNLGRDRSISQTPFSSLPSPKPISSYVVAPYTAEREIENRKKKKRKEKKEERNLEEEEFDEENPFN